MGDGNRGPHVQGSGSGPAELSIIVITYNSAAHVGRCLQSLEEAVGAWGGAAEILVVDNASTDDTVPILAGRPGVCLLPQERNLGFAAGVNVGLRHARGRWVLLQNPDGFLVKGLNEMVDRLRAHPEVAAVGPRIEDGEGRLELSCGRFPTLWSELCENFALRPLRPRSPLFAGYRYGGWDRREDRRVDWLTGACLLLRMEALERVGPLDEDFFLYTEEVELQYRLAGAGYESWYLARPRAVHLGGRSARSHEASFVLEGRLHVEFVRSLSLFFRKHRGPVQARWHGRLLAAAYALRLLWALARLVPPGSRAEAQRRVGVFLGVLRGLCLGFGAENRAQVRLRLTG